jgi:hypothetical protein
MTMAALNDLEATFGIQLPLEYTQAMQSYPFAKGHFGSQMLWDDITALKRRNLAEKNKMTRKARPDPTAGFFS